MYGLREVQCLLLRESIIGEGGNLSCWSAGSR